MSLGATWWAGTGSPNYTDIRCDYDFSGASPSSSTSGSWIEYRYGPCGWLIFMPNKKGGVDDLNVKDPEYGFVWAKKDSDSSEKGLGYVQHNLRGGVAVSRATGETMYRPFDRETTSDSEIVITRTTGGSDTYSIFIFQPYAWYGRVAEVIGAILKNQGIDTSFIDYLAFSDADDGQAAMGSADNEEPFVFYRREIGQTLAEAIKALAGHCWDILTINMAGKISLVRRLSPDSYYSVSSLGTGDGVISVQHRYAYEHLANCGWVCEGRHLDATLEDVGSPDFYNRVATCNEVAYPGRVYSSRGLPFEELEDTTSITKYGRRPIGKRTIDLLQDNEVLSIRFHHFPYLCNVEGSASGDPLQAKAVLAGRVESVDSVLRREVTVVQDMRGLDYDVGFQVQNVTVTKDNVTITDTRCIKKTIDFDDMSVTSVLLEEPS